VEGVSKIITMTKENYDKPPEETLGSDLTETDKSENSKNSRRGNKAKPKG
jgi:hypothetical protein